MNFLLPNIKPSQLVGGRYRELIHQFRIPQTLLTQIVLDAFLARSRIVIGAFQPMTQADLWGYVTTGQHVALDELIAMRKLELGKPSSIDGIHLLPAVGHCCQMLYEILKSRLLEIYTCSLNLFQDRLFITRVGDEGLIAEVFPYERRRETNQYTNHICHYVAVPVLRFRGGQRI